MLNDILFFIWPFYVPSNIVCNVEVGELFQDDSSMYLLLERDAVKAKVVHWNIWTGIWWKGSTLEYRSKVTNRR
jgi:hypothetical protein